MIFTDRKVKHLSIVGLGLTCYDHVMNQVVNFPEDPGETWTINTGGRIWAHDVLFDMHTNEWLDSKPNNEKETGDPKTGPLRRRKWLQTHDKPIVMPKVYPEIPTSIEYPLKEVMESMRSDYFSIAVAYMLGLAGALKHTGAWPLETLTLYGIDYSYERERATHSEMGSQCTTYWIRALQDLGVNIGLPMNTHLMDMDYRRKGYIYGYDQPIWKTLNMPQPPGWVDQNPHEKAAPQVSKTKEEKAAMQAAEEKRLRKAAKNASPGVEVPKAA